MYDDINQRGIRPGISIAAQVTFWATLAAIVGAAASGVI